MADLYSTLTAKQRRLAALRPLPPAAVRAIEAALAVELTYTSNAIEGNTLNRRETAVVVEKGITVAGKTLREHLEATNHIHALDYVRSISTNKPHQITRTDILTIHSLILRSIDDENAGRYRDISVLISGSPVALPSPMLARDLMDEFYKWLKKPNDQHPVALAGEAHYRLVTIHPFTDGNGRTARLLMNLILMMHGYPPAIIRPRDRIAYIAALETAQLGGSREAFDELIAKSAARTLELYLKALNGEATFADDDAAPQLWKIGQLAKAAGVTVPTIRFWTKEGLLEVSGESPGGYQLYAPEMLERCRKIQSLKSERLTLIEIRGRLVDS